MGAFESSRKLAAKSGLIMIGGVGSATQSRSNNQRIKLFNSASPLQSKTNTPTPPALKIFSGAGKYLAKDCLAKWGCCLQIFKADNEGNQVTAMSSVPLGT